MKTVIRKGKKTVVDLDIKDHEVVTAEANLDIIQAVTLPVVSFQHAKPLKPVYRSKVSPYARYLLAKMAGTPSFPLVPPSRASQKAHKSGVRYAVNHKAVWNGLGFIADMHLTPSFK